MTRKQPSPVSPRVGYLDEIINYGGEHCTRGAAILHMKSIGSDQGCIDRWLQGYELAERLREERESRAAESRNPQAST